MKYIICFDQVSEEVTAFPAHDFARVAEASDVTYVGLKQRRVGFENDVYESRKELVGTCRTSMRHAEDAEDVGTAPYDAAQLVLRRALRVHLDDVGDRFIYEVVDFRTPLVDLDVQVTRHHPIQASDACLDGKVFLFVVGGQRTEHGLVQLGHQVLLSKVHQLFQLLRTRSLKGGMGLKSFAHGLVKVLYQVTEFFDSGRFLLSDPFDERVDLLVYVLRRGFPQGPQVLGEVLTGLLAFETHLPLIPPDVVRT